MPAARDPVRSVAGDPAALAAPDSLQPGRHSTETAIDASRCPRCALVVVPPAAYCPHHPVAMVAIELPGVGEVVSYTTLHSPPEGFRSPLHIALVELDGGARFFCHGTETRGIKIGSRVAIEAVDSIFYFAQLGALERARLFWRRAGRAGDRVNAIARSWAKRAWRGRSRAEH